MSVSTSQSGKNQKRKEMPEEDPEFQIAPMVDILLVLLVFFMSISSTEVLQKNQNIKLPVARDASTSKETKGGQSIVNVMWLTTGAVQVDDKDFPDPASIVPILQKSLSVNPNLRVLLRADRDVRYEYMRSVLEAIGKSGVANVTFSVVDKEGADPQ